MINTFDTGGDEVKHKREIMWNTFNQSATIVCCDEQAIKLKIQAITIFTC